jgi:serine/threonine protein kinase
MKENFSSETLLHVASFSKGKNGTFVDGYLCEPLQKLYAIKSANPALCNYHALVDRLQREMQILSFIQAGNASNNRSPGETHCSLSFVEKISFYRFFIVRNYDLSPQITHLPTVYLCLEAILGGNLHQQLHHNNSIGSSFPLFQVRVYMTQLINLLLYFYSIGLTHRDLKLSNILVNSFGHIKVCDFGSAIILDRDNTVPSFSSSVRRSHTLKQRTRTITGTLPFLSPEMIAFGVLSNDTREDEKKDTKEKREEGYSYSVDWWSLGHILYELITKEILPLSWYLDGNEMMKQNEIEDTDFKDSKLNEISHLNAEETKFNRYHQLLAQQAIVNDEEGFNDINNSWSYEKVSRLPSLIEKSQKKKNTFQNRDFASFIPSSFDYYDPDEETHLTQAHELINKLLNISPKNRFICSAFSDDLTITEVENLLESKEFQNSLYRPFLIQELLFPNDLLSVSSESDYVSSFLLNKKYQFEINEKICVFYFFTEFIGSE